MTTWAIIPVKPLHESKRRLAHLLSADTRAELILQFLDNLLAVLNETPGIDHTLVVTGDPTAMAMGQKYGAELLIEPAPAGLNAAVSRGVEHAADLGATTALILPADLPFACVEDIEAMLQPVEGRASSLLAISGDEVEDGTNALLLTPPGDFTFHYGPDSFAAHLAEAKARGRAVHKINAPGLRFDLDTEADWLAYSGQPSAVTD